MTSDSSACHSRRFTLVEIVAVLIIGGILVAVAGLGLANIAHGFERARVTYETAQKAQLAITRVSKELTAGATVAAATTSSISFSSPRYPEGQTIALAGTLLRLGSDTLVDGVSGFSVVVTTDMSPSVTFSLVLAGTDSVAYTATVFP